jgi:glycosyltransferase involved in cell wall biosynthesis
MACGAPVVASNVSSLPEVLGDAALLVDPRDVGALADAVERVIADAALRADLCARGVKRAAQFSWERAARETLDVYRAVAARQ